MKPKQKVVTFHGDPFTVEVAYLIGQSRLGNAQIAAKVGEARHHGMSPSTVENIRTGATKRPTNYTLEWILFALGYARRLVPLNAPMEVSRGSK